jgi:hypothetical protein
MILGFCYGEEKRRKDNGAIFPLIDLKIDRDGCKRLIREAGWEVPDRSGCFICPFQRKLDWVAMQQNNPELFQRAVALEKNSKYSYHRTLKLEDWLKDDKDQSRIMDFEEYQHCICAND